MIASKSSFKCSYLAFFHCPLSSPIVPVSARYSVGMVNIREGRVCTRGTDSGPGLTGMIAPYGVSFWGLSNGTNSIQVSFGGLPNGTNSIQV